MDPKKKQALLKQLEVAKQEAHREARSSRKANPVTVGKLYAELEALLDILGAIVDEG